MKPLWRENKDALLSIIESAQQGKTLLHHSVKEQNDIFKNKIGGVLTSPHNLHLTINKAPSAPQSPGIITNSNILRFPAYQSSISVHQKSSDLNTITINPSILQHIKPLKTQVSFTAGDITFSAVVNKIPETKIIYNFAHNFHKDESKFALDRNQYRLTPVDPSLNTARNPLLWPSA